jgi:cytochrome c2
MSRFPAMFWRVGLILCVGCSRSIIPHQTAATPVASDLMIRYGCPTCHVIPGVPGAVGKVGPSLRDLGQRSYLAATLQNSPDNLILWIQHPQRIHPGTAMPEMGVTRDDARRIATFLEASK